MHDHIPVKVWLRSVASIRGTLTGTLMAYDKHMNLVRPCCWPGFVLIQLQQGLSNVSEEVVLRRKGGQLEPRRRHLRQMFLKGDSVVLVALLSSSASSVASGT